MVNRDYYQLLGVSPDASQDEIRSAYRKRISVIHPDRFDAMSQPEQWQAANEMLMEINSAYDMLHHPHRRALYDERRAAPHSKRISRTVHCRFDELPDAARQRLLVMQNGRSRFFKLQSHKPANLFRFKTGGPAPAWCGLLAPPLLLGASLALALAGGWRVASEWLWASVLLCAAAAAVAGLKLALWYRSPVKAYVYLTPLYYIETRPGEVVFRWLWSSETLMVVPASRRLGRGNGGLLVLAFDDKPHRLRLATEATAREVASALSVWEKLIVDGKNDGQLLDQLDAFPEISARLGKRPMPDLRADGEATKNVVDDGAARRGAVAIEAQWLYKKGW